MPQVSSLTFKRSPYKPKKREERELELGTIQVLGLRVISKIFRKRYEQYVRTLG